MTDKYQPTPLTLLEYLFKSSDNATLCASEYEWLTE